MRWSGGPRQPRGRRSAFSRRVPHKEIAQLIKDTTGIHRFGPIRYSANPDWDFLNGVDWLLHWQSIQGDDACPMKPFKAELKDVQEDARQMGRVEQWLVQFDLSEPKF